MKKKIFIVLLLVLVAICSLGLVACSSGNEGGGSNGEGGGSSGDIGGGGIGGGEHSHNYEFQASTEPNCENEGFQNHYRCDCQGYFILLEDGDFVEVTAESLIIPASHTLDLRAGYPGSCQQEGMKDYWECNSCGKRFADQNGNQETTYDQLITPPVHNLEIVEAVDSTCTTQGNIEHWSCLKCFEKFSDSQGLNYLSSVKTEKVDHTYGMDKTCGVCGAHKPTDGLVFNSYLYGVVVESFGQTTDTEIYIPETVEYNGNMETVVGIALGCITDVQKDSVIKIHIPKSIIYLPSGYTGDYFNFYNPFYDCNTLTDVYVDEDNAKFKSVDGVLYSKDGSQILCYPNGKTTAEMVISNDITKLGYYSFANNKNLTEVTLGASLKSVDDWAFYGCSNLTKVNLNDGLENIEYGVFAECSSLYDVKLPDSLLKIGDTSFKGTAITSLTIPNSVTYVGTGAYDDCVKLRYVKVGQKVNYIGSHAFDGCEKLVSVINLSGLNIVAGAWDYGQIAYNAIEVRNMQSNDNLFLTMDDGLVFYRGLDYCYVIDYVGDSDTIVMQNNYYNNAGINNPANYDITEYKIYKGAFANKTNIKYLSVSSSVNEIGEGAFAGCTSLIELYLPFVGQKKNNAQNSTLEFVMGSKNVEDFPNFTELTVWSGNIQKNAFAYNNVIKEVVLQSQVREIGDSAFKGASNLSKVTFEGSEILLSKIGEYAFQNCTSLTSFYIPYLVSQIGQYAFNGCTSLAELNVNADELTLASNIMGDETNELALNVKIGRFVKYIPDYMFNNCKRLTTLVIEDSSFLETIGYSAFATCENLTSVVLPSTVTSIDDNAFYGCSNLATVDLLKCNKLVSIGKYAFKDCALIPYIDISYSVETIGDEAFSGCLALETVNVLETYVDKKYQSYLVTIGNGAFNGCAKLTTIYLPESLTSIGAKAFGGCTSLAEINLHFIGGSPTAQYESAKFNYVFDDDFGGNVIIQCESVAQESFKDTGIKEVTIDKAVKSIGKDAFLGCNELMKVSYNGTINEWTEISFENINANPTTFAKCLYIDGKELVEINIDEATKIGNYSFSCLENVTNISVGNTVIGIGAGAFYGINGLKEITVPFVGRDFNGNSQRFDYMFTDDKAQVIEYVIPQTLEKVTINGGVIDFGFVTIKNNIKTVILGDEVTEIYGPAFKNMTELTEVTIGKGVTKMTSANGTPFDGCSKLSKVNYTGKVTEWAKINFYCNKEINGTLTVANPLYHAKHLYIEGQEITELDLSSLTGINSSAFINCQSITKVIIGNGLLLLNQYAFNGCTGIQEVYYGGSASDFDKLVIADGNNDIFFANIFCYDSAEQKYLPYVSDLTYTLSSDGTYYTVKGNSTGMVYFKIIVIPETYNDKPVKEISSQGFWNQTSYMNTYLISIPASVEKIGRAAFYGPYSASVVKYGGTIDQWAEIEFQYGTSSTDRYASNPLYSSSKAVLYVGGEAVTSVNLTTATKVNKYAFTGYDALTEVTIGESVTSIGEFAFADCTNLTKVTFVDVLGWTDGTNSVDFSNQTENVTILQSGKSYVKEVE